MMMKNIVFLFLAVLGFGLFSACKSQKAVVASFSDLDGEWGVTELNGKPLNPSETHQVVTFDTLRKHLSGNAGCNRMTGAIEYNAVQKNIIKFPQIATTRMACMDMAGEQELLDALHKVVRFEAVGESAPVQAIALYGTDNRKLVEIKKQK